jgi:hypothetical protein
MTYLTNDLWFHANSKPQMSVASLHQAPTEAVVYFYEGDVRVSVYFADPVNAINHMKTLRDQIDAWIAAQPEPQVEVDETPFAPEEATPALEEESPF